MRQPLTRYRLHKIIDAREADLLEPDPPPTLKHLETYASGTASQLLQLQVGALLQNHRHIGDMLSSLDPYPQGVLWCC